MRPFLHGAPPPPSLSQAPRLDMVALILKARALQYDSVDDYLADVRTLVTQVRAHSFNIIPKIGYGSWS